TLCRGVHGSCASVHVRLAWHLHNVPWMRGPASAWVMREHCKNAAIHAFCGGNTAWPQAGACSSGEERTAMLERIKSELRRIGALDIAVCEDREFEPAVEDLVHVRYDQSEWHLITPQFVELLQELPEGAGAEA